MPVEELSGRGIDAQPVLSGIAQSSLDSASTCKKTHTNIPLYFIMTTQYSGTNTHTHTPSPMITNHNYSQGQELLCHFQLLQCVGVVCQRIHVLRADRFVPLQLVMQRLVQRSWKIVKVRHSGGGTVMHTTYFNVKTTSAVHGKEEPNQKLE